MVQRMQIPELENNHPLFTHWFHNVIKKYCFVYGDCVELRARERGRGDGQGIGDERVYQEERVYDGKFSSFAKIPAWK